MFSIYDYDGRVFRNTLEELYKVNPVAKTDAMIRAKEDLNTETPQIPGTPKRHIPNTNALQAYRDLIHANPKEELRHAYEIMQEQFVVLRESQTIHEALNILLNSHLNALPVVNDKQRIIGLFSHKIILEKLLKSESDLPNLRITQLSTLAFDKVITAEPVTSIRRIAEVMFRYNLSLIPITDSYEDIVGIITSREISKAIANEPPLSIWT